MTENRIVLENQKVGTARAIWDAPSSNQIEGFATNISVDNGGSVAFKVNVNAAPGASVPYHIEIYRLGYYGGDGATLVTTINGLNGTLQPAPMTDARGLADAGNWTVSANWASPADAVSGVYLARLVRDDNGATNQIPFIIRDDANHSDIVLQTSDTTWQAYNGWGGLNGQVAGNFYGGFSQPGTLTNDPGPLDQNRAFAVSYNRPILTRDGGGAASGAQDYLFGADYAAIQWLEQNGFDVSYISGVDTDRLGSAALTSHRAYISVGHDEYWSGAQRAHVEAARDAGVNLLFWSGNEVYWKTRWETSIDGSGTEYRTLVCYKETWANGTIGAGPADYANIDPSNEWTGTWRDVRFVGNPGATGQRPENSLTGQLFGPDGDGELGGALNVPAEFSALRVWRDTGVAPGGTSGIAPGIIGYEWDTAPNDASRPNGLVRLSQTTLNWNSILTDQGSRTSPGTATHDLTVYRAESGALVFGAGTTFWSWGLSNAHDSSPYGANIASPIIQQFTLNLFADMGIQPGVVDAVLLSQGLARAALSNDHIGATATMADLPASIAARQSLLITGTASDVSHQLSNTDGQVALVEVSFDGGAHWLAAQGTTNWSYSWRPTTEGVFTVQARAIDDSLNIHGLTIAQDVVTVTAPTLPATFNLFDPASPVTAFAANENTAIELGMRFSVAQPGTITQLKYWRAAADAGDTDIRDAHLWSSTGTVLATATVTSGVGQSGWQTVTLATPVDVVTGQTYTVSYRTNDGYVLSNGFFAAANEVTFDGLDNDAFTDPYGQISAPQDAPGAGNGVFHYGAALVLPTDSFQASNYWVDVTFARAGGPANAPPVFAAPTAFTLPENTTSAGRLVATDADGNPLTFAIAGGADAPRFTVDAATGALSFVTAPDYEAPADAGGNNVYDLIVSASDGIAAPVTQAIAVTVTDVVETNPAGSRVFSQAGTPAAFFSADMDATNYELGTKFTANQDGQVTALQYFRGTVDADDTDVRPLTLWSVGGVALGTVTITSGTNQSGWQVGTLATPVAITANTTYVVSYSYVFDNGVGARESYAATGGYFNTAHPGPDGVLTGLASGASGGNGVYAPNAPGIFPTQSFNATGYFVDVLFRANPPPDTVAPTLTVAINDTVVNATETAQVTITASEAVTGLTASDVVVTGGSIGPLMTIDNIVFTTTFAPAAGAAGAASLVIAASSYTDLAGNPGGGGSTAFAVDTVAPTLTIAISDSLLNAAETAQVTITASEAVTGLTASDVVVTGGAIGALITSDNIVFTATFMPAASTTGPGNLSIVAGSYADLAGNAGAGGSRAFAVDTQAPVLSIAALAASQAEGNGGSTGFTFTVTRSGDVSAASTAHWAVSGSGANPAGATDFAGGLLPAGTVSFAAGQTSQTITVAVAGDSLFEPDERFTITLTSPSGATLGTASAAGLILNDDTALPGGGTTITGVTVWGQSFQGTPGRDVFDIGGGNNRVDALGDDDRITLAGWNNHISAGDGDDVIDAGQGNATVDAGPGNDRVTVAGWNNLIDGGAGNDTIDGGQGNATIRAGEGNNAITVHGWNNTITAGAGNDTVQGVDGNSSFDLGDGNNVIQSWGWNNVVHLGHGRNLIEDFDGNSQITAGDGQNTIGLHGWNNVLQLGHGNNHVVVAAGGNTTITGGNGANTIELSGWNNSITLGDGGDKVWAGMGMSVIRTGGGADQVWIGGSGASDISTGAGDDVIYTGGAYGDTLRGGTGNDQYVIRQASDVITENMGEGIDTAWVEVDGYVLAANVEFGRLSAQATQLTGSAGSDTLVTNALLGGRLDGGAGADTLWGSDVADVLKGGLGDDELIGGRGADVFVFDAANWGADRIRDFSAAEGDRLDMRGLGLSSMNQLQVVTGTDTLVTFGGNSIYLFHVSALSGADFIFG